jgi:DNA polymerase-3 subunit beta
MNPKHQIHIAAKALKAAVVLAAKQDVRYYLNGVFVQAWVNETRLVATDGRLMGVIRDERDNSVPHGTAPIQFIVPRDVIEGLKLGKKDMDTLVIQIDVPEDMNAEFVLHAGPLATRFRRVDSTFPHYARVIPTKTSGVVCQYNPDLLAQMSKALRILYSVSPTGIVPMRIEHNGEIIKNEDGSTRRADSGALVYGKHNNFVGVIMPLRDWPEDMGSGWTHEPPAMPQQSEAA